MKTKARIIVTTKCPRNCSYCANKNKEELSKAIPLSNIRDLPEQYTEVCLSGGEPLTDENKLVLIIDTLKVLMNKKVYMYTASYTIQYYRHYLLQHLDGITFTLHENSDEYSINCFESWQNEIDGIKNKSFRLNIHRNNTLSINIIPEVWNRIEFVDWKDASTCKLPDDEDLFILT